jgi:GDP-4-dehydro-6-deoxy-D-mannose reductase
LVGEKAQAKTHLRKISDILAWHYQLYFFTSMKKKSKEMKVGKKALVIGSTGMIGTEFVKVLRERGYEVYGIARGSAASRAHTPLYDKSFIPCDILDESMLRKVMAKVVPDLVIHLAAQAFNGWSWDMEHITHQTNYFGTLHVLRVCREIVPKAKILLACSSAEYGIISTAHKPIKEDSPLRPISPYGVSKVAVENLGYHYFLNYKMKIYLPRLFVHVGTGHPPATMIQNFARQCAQINAGKIEPIMHVGNMNSVRDFIDVRDGVAGMMLLLENGPVAEPVNICTQTSYSVKDILAKLKTISGVNPKIVSDPNLTRPSDDVFLVGDNSKLRKLGWKQKYSIDETLKAVYEDWLARI